LPTVVPSQIVDYIDHNLGFCLPPRSSFQLSPHACGTLTALVSLIDQLPSSLLPADPRSYATVVQNAATIRFMIRRAESQDSTSEALTGWLTCNVPVVETMRKILATCLDEVPPHHSSELPFIKDPPIRDGILMDLEASRSALANAAWKAATVLAGSIVEALLLWALKQQADDAIAKACGALMGGKLQERPPADLLEWVLHQYVTVAAQMKLIEQDTAKQADLAKDFRNLIHPGRAIRRQKACDRGTALGASAAVELVLRDLTVRFP